MLINPFRSAIRLASVSISAKACSAHEMLARRRTARTLTPRDAQAGTSMLRRMAPYLCTTFRRGANASSSGPIFKLSVTTASAVSRLLRRSSWDFTSRTSLGYSDLAAVLTLSHQARKSGKSGDMKSANAFQRSGPVVGSRTTPIRRVQTSSSTISTGFLDSIIAGSIFKRRTNSWLMARATRHF